MDTRLFLACFSALLLLHTSIATHYRGDIITWRTIDPYSDASNDTPEYPADSFTV